MHLEIGEAENLYQVESLSTVVSLRLFELLDAGFSPYLIDLRRDEEGIPEVR